MSDVTDIVVPRLEGVYALLARIEVDLANIKEDTRHIKVRLTSLDAGMSSLNPAWIISVSGLRRSNSGLM